MQNKRKLPAPLLVVIVFVAVVLTFGTSSTLTPVSRAQAALPPMCDAPENVEPHISTTLDPSYTTLKVKGYEMYFYWDRSNPDLRRMNSLNLYDFKVVPRSGRRFEVLEAHRVKSCNPEPVRWVSRPSAIPSPTPFQFTLF